MLKQGLFEIEKPDAIFGLHVSNFKNGQIWTKPGPIMASAEAFRITVQGRQTHGSRPWSGVDPIIAASDIATTLQTIVSRRLNLLDSQAVVTVGIMKLEEAGRQKVPFTTGILIGIGETRLDTH